MPENKVLIIDDNIDLTSIICMILKAEGYVVQACNTLEEGLFYLKDWKPDVLLLDVNIDGEDGRVLCQKIKSDHKESPGIILMSGDETTLENWASLGADEFISKPFESTELIQKIALCMPNHLIPDT